ncbi:hypothetical protein MKS88_003416 [Plasmodium brasilianum]|uniref:Uncharacterized protein n=1 Tax=Plasmodium brasilianum TaxID=5824 RepID=A0ACB9Y9A4_PLABR|nr:hypothetical protein MKS88_003416 [Plasmodium brasilianum]
MKRVLNITFYLIFFYFCIYISSARPTNNDNNEQGINNRKNNLRKGSEYNGQLIGSSDNGDANLQQDGNHINMVGNDGHGASGGDNTRESTVNLRSVQAEGVESQSGTTHREHGSGLTASTETAVEGCTNPECKDSTPCTDPKCPKNSGDTPCDCKKDECPKCIGEDCSKGSGTCPSECEGQPCAECPSGSITCPQCNTVCPENRTNGEKADVRSEDQGSKSEPDTTVTNSLQEIKLTDKGNIDITNEEELVKEEIEDVDNDDTEEEEEQEQVITEDTIKEDMEEEEDDEDEEEEEQEEEQIQQENEKEPSQKNEEKESRTNDTKAHDSLAKDYREDIEIKKMADTFVSTLISLLDNSNGADSTIKDLSKDITQFLLT